MGTVHIVDNKTKKETHSFKFSVEEPYEMLFVKNRETQQNYLMIRTSYDSSNPYEKPENESCEKFEVPYDRYSDVSLELEK